METEIKMVQDSVNIVLVRNGKVESHKFAILPEEDELSKKIFNAVLDGIANEVKSVV